MFWDTDIVEGQTNATDSSKDAVIANIKDSKDQGLAQNKEANAAQATALATPPPPPPPPPSAPEPLPPNPSFPQLQQLGVILNDIRIKTNMERFLKIKSSIGDIIAPENSPLKNWISSNSINCITPHDKFPPMPVIQKNPFMPNIETDPMKLLTSYGCTGKTGDPFVDALLATNPSSEEEATVLINNLRILVSSQMNNLLKVEVAKGAVNIVKVQEPPPNLIKRT